MAQWMLRPDLKTQGGETHDIVYNDQYVGMMTLVYRENDRLTGAVQLEADELGERDKELVLEKIQRHVEATAEALGVRACDVIVTYSQYERIITRLDEDFDLDWVEDDSAALTDIDPIQHDDYEMMFDGDAEEARQAAPGFELMIVYEDRHRIEYHVYDEDLELAAEVFVQIEGGDVSGTVDWTYEPFDEDIDAVTELLVADFDDNKVETFRLANVFGEDLIDAVELTRNDLLEDEEISEIHANRDDYSIVLARDDGDVLTYEIYQESTGALPIGTATIDISYKQLTGFIDFRDPGTADDRELIAMLLMEELDKEKDYDSLNVSMMVKNKLIDEILFETEHVH